MEGGDLCDPLEMVTGREGRLQWMICYRSEDETGRLDLEKKERNRRFTVGLPAFLTNSYFYHEMVPAVVRYFCITEIMLVSWMSQM